MKRLIFAFIAIFSVTMEAQNITDAVRYSTTDLNGTARYRAMSGAFGALGGDLSSINVNPAGSAVFLNSFTSFTLNIENSENQVSYMNGFNSNSNTNLDLGQAGAVFVFNSNNPDANWRKFSLAFNYNKSANFEDDFLAFGSNSNSIDQYFLDYAQGIAVDYLVPFEDESVAELYSILGEDPALGFAAQQAFLGHYGEIITVNNPNNLDPNDPGSGYYDLNSYSSALGAGIFDQEYSYAATGLNGKFSFNFATQYQDFLYLGLNLNSHFLNYDRVTSFYEFNDNPGSTINDIFFENRLSTLGSGFSFQLGGLAKVGENLRAGIAFESPTWYQISEETTQYLETYNDRGWLTVDPNVVNIYPDYNIQTPAKYTGSLAYLFGSNALVSFDYSYKDYSTTEFRPKDDAGLAFQNSLMETNLQAASTYRIGGEYRIKGWSLRGGYRLEESPYADTTNYSDLEGYSAGLGYNFGNFRIDLSYDTYKQDIGHELIQTGLADRAQIEKDNSNFILTLSLGI